MEIISGFEPTRIITKEFGLEKFEDVLDSSLHLYKFEEDLDFVQEIGIRTLRVAIPWHRIEINPREYNWVWTDAYMHSLQKRNIEPILDPLHHVSIPSWLTHGFLDDRFVESYINFFHAVVKRYPWVRKYTIVNEPLVTTYFSCGSGVWYPFKSGEENFNKGLDNIFKVIYHCSLHLELLNKEHWYVEPAEYHYGTCESSNHHADFKNEWRFVLLDRLINAGVKINVLGLDYYAHCEFEWSKERIETSSPIGFYKVAKQYIERYNLPIALTETNIRGFAEDRLSWFIHMWEECKKLEDEGVDIRAFCWYPFIDSTDWDSLLQKCNKNIDPQGIMHLDEKFRRNKNVFFDAVSEIIKGKDISEIKRHKFKPPLDQNLKGFVNNLMKDWKWE